MTCVTMECYQKIKKYTVESNTQWRNGRRPITGDTVEETMIQIKKL